MPPSHQLQNREVARGTGIFCVQTNAKNLPEEKKRRIARKWIDIGFSKAMSVKLVKVRMRTSGNYPSSTSPRKFKGPEFPESPKGNKWID